MDLNYDDFRSLSGVSITNEDNLKNSKIANVCIDSRKCTKHDIFVAIKGDRFDGHDFINKLIKKGVKLFIADKKWFSKKNLKKADVSFVLVNDTIKALGELASIYRSKFLIPVIAVAGSNGKTSTKDMVANVLSQQYTVLNTEGNYNNSIGLPMTLFKLNSKYEICVVEIGTNHFGEIKTLCTIARPQFGVITNIGKEHLEFLQNVNGVKKEEFELIDYLKNNNGTFFLNKNDLFLSKLKSNGSLKIFSYGSNNNNDVSGRINNFYKFFPNISIKYGKNIINTTLSMPGKQSFDSSLSAASIGYFFEVPSGKIKNAISEYKIASKKRNDLINLNGIWIIDDTYNSNPDSVKIALDNLKQYKTNGSKHIVLSDMLELGDKGKIEHTKIGKYVKKLGFSNLYTFGSESYYTYSGAKGINNNFYFNDKETIAELLKLTLKVDDIVLIKGSRAMKMEEIIESLKEV